VRKLRAVVPEERHASAHRAASNTDKVNSARRKRLICSAKLRIRIFLSGVLDINVDKKGFSRELS